MLDSSLKEELKGIRFELIDLNQAAYFYVRKMNRIEYIFQKTTREYVLEELYALRYLENGLILHLTNLDDKDSKYSFRTAQKQLNKLPVDQKLLRNLNQGLDDFRKKINHIKTQHRNSRIAHINSLDFPNLDEFLNFDSELKPLINKANQIGDLIWGEKIQNKFKLGSMEGILDFRELFNQLEINLSANRDFA